MSKCPFKTGEPGAFSECSHGCEAWDGNVCVFVHAAATFVKYLEQKMTPVMSVFPASAPAPEVKR